MNELTHILDIGGHSRTLRTGTMVEGYQVRIFKKKEIEGYERTRLHLTFNHKSEPTILIVEGMMTYGPGLNLGELMESIQQQLAERVRSGLMERPFKITDDGVLFTVQKLYQLEINTAAAQQLLDTANEAVKERDGKGLLR